MLLPIKQDLVFKKKK